MAIRTRNRSVTERCDDDVNLQRVELYRADASASPPNHPRVRITFTASNGSTTAITDHALSEYSSLNASQKTTLGTLVQSLFTETLTLEGFA